MEIHGEASDAHVLVIDDNSPDGTGALADSLAAQDPRIHVLHREGKLGLGSATVAGFRYAVEHGYDFLLNMDADFSHHPRHIAALRQCMESADVGIGSRYVPGGGAFRCFRVSTLAGLDFDQVRSRGYSFQEEILYMCRRSGCRFEETPITFEDRRFGTSKINWQESVWAVWIIFRLGLDRITRRRVSLST